MNGVFQQFLSLPEEDRADVFEAAAEELNTKSTYVEKDFNLTIPRIAMMFVHFPLQRFIDDIRSNAIAKVRVCYRITSWDKAPTQSIIV